MLFGNITIKPYEIFYETGFTVGLVNLKPIVPGHVLVVPRRSVLRYADLNASELKDLTESAQRIATAVERVHSVSSVCWVIQDGKDAGQTVPHVHLHIIPCRFGAWDKNMASRPERTAGELENESKLMRAALYCMIQD